MSAFEHDTQITVFHLHKKDAIDESYTMILVNDEACNGMKGLGKKANVVHSMSECLDIWKHTETHQLRTLKFVY